MHNFILCFKDFIFNYRWHKTVSLTIIMAFFSSIISPTFASNTHEAGRNFLFEKSAAEDITLVENFLLTSLYPENIETNVLENNVELPSDQENLNGSEKDIIKQDQNSSDGIIKGSLNLIAKPLYYIVSPLSDEDKEKLEGLLMGFSDPKNAEFYADYIDAIRPLVVKEFTKKSMGRGVRASVFSGELKSAYSISDSGIFLKRSVAEIPRNIRTLVKVKNKAGEYQESGKIIRNSLVGHLIVLPLQIAVGHTMAPGFKKLGLPEDAANMADVYSRYNSWGSTFGEFSGKTADNLLALERPEYQWIPNVAQTGLTYIFYYGSNTLLGDAAPINNLKRLALSETASSVCTSSLLFLELKYDEKYDKYQIFNVASDGVFSMETMKEIASYGLPVFQSQVSGTISGSLGVMTIGMLGKGALGARRDFDVINLFISPLVAAGSQVAGKLVADSRASDDSLSELNQTILMGMISNTFMAAPYIAILISPNLISKPENHALTRVMALVNVVLSVERAAIEELAAFKQDEQGWLKTIGDWTKIGVPTAGFILFRCNLIERNTKNYFKIQVAALVPPVLNIIAVLVLN